MISPRSFLVSRQKDAQCAAGNSSPASSPRTLARTRSSYETQLRSSIVSTRPLSTPAMAPKRKESDRKSPPLSPPRTTTTLTRPTTPTSPVTIPVNSKNETAHTHKYHRHQGDKKHCHHAHHAHHASSSFRQSAGSSHNPDAIPASVAALLAITSIPRPKSSRSLRRRAAVEKRMTVDSIIEQAQEAEKEISITLSRSPLDLLLSAPEDLEDDDVSVCDSTADSILSANTVSVESVPSLSESFSTGTISSLETPYSPIRGRRNRPTRKSLEPISSPPGAPEVHPLSSPVVEVEELDFRVFENAPNDAAGIKAESGFPFRPLKSAFKSNLTASLRALRNAARSFSNMQLTSIPPEDFLTRSILTLDPRIPYTDERRPPPLEDEPSAALRRYLNPTTTSRIETRASDAAAPAGQKRTNFTASIQMQTYKVHRTRSGSPIPARAPYASRPSSSSSDASSQRDSALALIAQPGPRQREVRENSDFIRIAVMEMAMRKNGKLDDRKPGRARLALPPRKMAAKAYEVGTDGVPARWVAISI